MLNTITKIDEYSPLRGRVHVGDELVSINGHEVEDVLDYRYWGYEPRVSLVLRAAGSGREYTVKVKKGEGEDLGLDFEEYLMDRPWGCSNRCKFCFIDQLPKGLRRTLYFKDDDARLSFLTGSYITLTNLSEREMERICALKISPINVSVHATDGALRAELMGNPKAADIMGPLKRLADAGIVMDCQIVCCPGWNDRGQLSRTMRDLAGLYPGVNSVSIVPVGLTKHREGLPELTPFDRESAAETIDRVEAYAAECLSKLGSRVFWCSDELYLKAGREVPEDEYYEEYSQLENGVGLMRLLETEFMAALRLAEPDEGMGGRFTIATGVAAAPLLEKLLQTAHKKCGKINGQVCAIVNDFFGHTIDVAGLVTGGDLIAQLRGKDLGERVLIPHTMLRHGEGVFLDDVTLEEASAALGVPVTPTGGSGGELLDAMLGVNY
ncbi:MAG TPA: DUF512 domain-containing protein [Candidatus Scatomorpha intestinavium]|uniref:DUF512 domain-containing protein n=1 Tax=Candidatus Scatomorpha intestinavium TaxID=2840922 RepID=A0A9D0ZEC8_9FIRM|nr:DUF512 domain-containing protein [Candidatus Scatomorpha intestinavium]